MKEMIDHPAHYAENRDIEPVALIEDWDLSFCLGNAVKYISRAGRKDSSKIVEDIKKAIWYIEREKEFGKCGLSTRLKYIKRKWYDEVWTVDDVCNDWYMSPDLHMAIRLIHESLSVSKWKRDNRLDVAILYLINEIENVIVSQL